MKDMFIRLMSKKEKHITDMSHENWDITTDPTDAKG